MKTIDFLGYSVYSEDRLLFNLFPNRKLIINTINPHCYCEAQKDSYYKMALRHSDILLPDGIGIALAIRILTGLKINRVAGSDLHIAILQKMNEIQGKVFYMGSSPKTLEKIKERVNIEYPNITLDTYSPPYKPVLTDTDNYQILTAINNFQPDVVFVGMTAPKQEKWTYMHKDQINAKVIASIGAVFDFYAGTVLRPSDFWIKIGLEWMVRLMREPKRLWRRNFISSPIFLWNILLIKVGLINQ